MTWESAKDLALSEVQKKLFPSDNTKPTYKMPDYEWVHREMQKSGVTLSLLWVEYCEQCRTTGELSYQSTQFNKYYADYVHKTKATMHLSHKPGETMQVDWAGTTTHVLDTSTGELLDAYRKHTMLFFSMPWGLARPILHAPSVWQPAGTSILSAISVCQTCS